MENSRQFGPPAMFRPRGHFSNPGFRPYQNFSRGRGRGRGHFQNRNQHFEGNYNNNMNTNREFWCETCDRDFMNQQQLETHKQEHQKCNIDGCQFVAHPKVITKHIQMQHSSGLYTKIAKLNNPEEIQKWREERKKRYPTKLNIEKKEAQLNEKVQRGEKMGLKSDQRHFPRSDNYQNRTQNSRTDLKRKYPQNRVPNNHVKQPNNKVAPFPKKSRVLPEVVSDDTHKLKPFAGIQDLIDDEDVEEPVEEVNHIPIDDDILEEPTVRKETENTPALCGALSSLVNDYGSSDEEPDSLPVIKEQVKSNLPVNNQTLQNDDSGPEEIDTKTEKGTQNDMESSTSQIVPVPYKTRGTVPQRQNRPRANRFRPKPPSTLLQKLLHKEVLHERNIVLQCVRFIVENNYFDKQ